MQVIGLEQRKILIEQIGDGFWDNVISPFAKPSKRIGVISRYIREFYINLPVKLRKSLVSISFSSDNLSVGKFNYLI